MYSSDKSNVGNWVTKSKNLPCPVAQLLKILLTIEFVALESVPNGGEVNKGFVD